MSLLRRTLFAWAALAVALPLQAAPSGIVEVAGVKYEPTAEVAGARLHLNGAGVRYKTIFKVYAAGLYLPRRTRAADAVVDPAGPRRLHIVMLRDTDANELGRIFTRGVEENASRSEFAKSMAGTVKVGEMFAARRRLAAGDWLTVDYLPGTGTVISINGSQAMEPIKEPEFYSALMHVWVGRRPADAQLKDALLGRNAPARPET